MGAGGPLVSTVGFGTWPIGGKGYGLAADDEVAHAVTRALDLGITLFDTAPAYGGGYAEEFLGRVLAGQRDRVVLVTKGGLKLDETGGIVGRDSRAASLMRGLDQSLARLVTDYVDVFLIHWPDRQTPWDEAMTGLQHILRSGKARFVGVSNFHATELDRCCRLAPIATNEVAYSLFDRRWEKTVFPVARARGVGIAAYSPLAHGLLGGRYGRDHHFASSDWRAVGRNLSSPDLFVGENFQQNLVLVERLHRLAQGLELTVAQLALAWVLRDPLVATAITSPRRPGQVGESVGATTARLTADVWTELESVAARVAGRVEDLPL